MRSVRDKITKALSKNYDIDQRVVRLICDYPMKFFKDRAADDTDARPVRVRYFAAFVAKKQYEDKINSTVVDNL